MRIKYEKGIPPEIIAGHLVDFVRENNLVIGSVNIYIQTYDDEMKSVKTSSEDEYLVVKPSEKTKTMYSDDVAHTRRKRMKAV